MQSRIDKLIILSAALKTAQREQLKIVAADVDLRYQTLINKLNFNGDCLSLEQLLNFLEHPGAEPVEFLRELCGVFGHTLIPLSPPVDGNSGDLYRQMSQVAQEVGDVATALNAFAEDGKITRREKQKFAVEINQAIHALALLKQTFEEA